jgi:hypothetical protein
VALEKRIERLEELFQPSSEKQARRCPPPDFVAIMDEYSSMKAAMAENCYRGSPNGLVKIEPRDEALQHYGRPYTKSEFDELAIRRGLEKRGCYSPSEIDELTEEWLEFFSTPRKVLEAEIRARRAERGIGGGKR